MQETDVMARSIVEDSSPATAIALGRRPGAAVVLGGLAIQLYLVSFFLPALDGTPGYEAFILAVLFVIGLPMWLANPVFWFGVVRLAQGRYHSAGQAGRVALLLALSECWMFYDKLAVGYFVWVGSMVLLAAVGRFGEVDEDRPRRWPYLPDWRVTGEAARIVARFRR